MQEQQNWKKNGVATELERYKKRLLHQAVKDASFVAAEATTHKIGHSPEENVANLNWVK